MIAYLATSPLPSWFGEISAVATLCLVVLIFAWYGVPAIGRWAMNLVDTFREEIRAEREHGLQLVREERASNERALERMQAGYEKAMSEHREALDRNTDATEAMTKKIEEVLRSK